MKGPLFLLAAFAILFGAACERQNWEEARELHMKHEHHDKADGEKH